METSIIKIGNDIKSYRLEAGLTQEELSSLCGVERSQLSRIEAGKAAGVTFLTVKKILNALGREIEVVKSSDVYVNSIHDYINSNKTK